ncbi:unnamed protein product [Cunninghamella echinulata]
MNNNIKVVVRCRPLNSRELAKGSTCLIRMEGNQTIISRPPDQRTGKESEDFKAFTFDKSYWSADKKDPNYADQKTVYNDLGEELLDHAFNGYNCCIFAYGQTGSGKSYSMMGYGEDKGIIPKCCSELFNRINRAAESNDDKVTYRVEVSYIEIYNEKVRDLLNPKNKGNLKVREHPSTGPYVEDLSRLVVNSFDDINHLMDEGNKARTVAATNMNETSSRSHAVFTLFLTQKRKDDLTKLESEKVARISLVDLAGSERANSTGATGVRLKEGANINKSLTTLGKVIAGLAEQSNPKHKKKDAFIPYRDSVLTWLLKDSLGGNSKTTMVAAISPADYDETLSTLRYADQAKKIKTKAVVNEDPNVKMIRDLKSEIQALKQSLIAYVPNPEQLQISENGSNGSGGIQVLPSKPILITDAYGNATELTKREVVEQLKSSQKLLGDVGQTWEERVQTTLQIHQERESALAELGISVAKNEMGVYTPKNIPYLVNLNEDPLMSECLVYQIKPGTTIVGRIDDEKKQCIRLSGSNILDYHCKFENEEDGKITIYPAENSITMINGIHISEPKQLYNGYRIILGDYHVFRFNHPDEVRKERNIEQQKQQSIDKKEKQRRQSSSSITQKQQQQENINDSTTIINGDGTGDDNSDTHSNIGSLISDGSMDASDADWYFARREVIMNYFQQQEQQQQQQQENNNGTTAPTCFDSLTNEELEKLFDDVTKQRRIRKRQSSQSAGGVSLPMSPCSSTSSFSFRRSATPSSVSTILGEGGYYSSYLDDSESVIDREIIRLAREELQQQLDEQKNKYEKRIQRLSCLYPMSITMADPELISPIDGPGQQNEVYSEDDRFILGKVIRHWRDQRYVYLAENLLMNGATIYEANALARELNKKVVYQLTIIHNTTCAGSNWEEENHATRLDPTLLDARKPCIGVRVIDSKHQCTYLWSLERLKTRLRHMQGIKFATDQRSHLIGNGSHPTNEMDLFYETYPPQFALIGLAKIRLRHLALHIPVERTLDIFCQRTCRVVGQVTVLIAPIARSKERHPISPNNSTTTTSNITNDQQKDDNNNNSSSSSKKVNGSMSISTTNHKMDQNSKQQHQDDTLQVGQHLVFEVRIGSLTGISENEFTHVHVQFRLSSFGTTFNKDNDQVLSTSCASKFDKHQCIDFEYAKTFSMMVTEEMLNAIRYDHLTFEVYGQPQPDYLTTFKDEPCASHQLPSIEKKHNVFVWLEICEIARLSGEYTPVKVKTTSATANNSNGSFRKYNQQGNFLLRQGQQRRIILTIRHDWVLPKRKHHHRLNGYEREQQELSEEEVEDDNDEHDYTSTLLDELILWIGNIRPRNNDHDHSTTTTTKTTTSQDLSIPLTITKQTKDTLTLQGAWDSSMHNSTLLNRITEDDQTVDITLKWTFHGIPFQMDVGVQITSDGGNGGLQRNKSLLKQLFSSSQEDGSGNGGGTNNNRKKNATGGLQRKTSVASIFRVWERPRRLSSYHIHQQVNTEHHEWQQHQLDKIKQYDVARRKMLTKLEVEDTRYTLALLDYLQKRHISMDRLLLSPVSLTFQENHLDKKEEDHDEQQQQKDHLQLKTIVQRWIHAKHAQRTGLQLINEFGSAEQLSPTLDSQFSLPLYDVHQLILSEQNKKDSFMLHHYGYLKIRLLNGPHANDQTENDDSLEWTQRWFVLKRPYLILYENENEANELEILYIQAVRVNPSSKEINNTFTIYTSMNTYQCQAEDQNIMKEWVASMI